MFPIIIGKNTGIYLPERSMPIVAYTVHAGIVYEGRGETVEEATYDLGLRLSYAGLVEDPESWDWTIV